MTNASIRYPPERGVLRMGGYCTDATRSGRELRESPARPLLLEPGLQRDQRELLPRFRPRLPEQLEPEPVALRKCAEHEIGLARERRQIAERHSAQPLHRARRKSHQEPGLIGALPAERPRALQDH